MKLFVRGLLTVVIASICAMWIYGLFFASKQAVNKFDDRLWAEKAQSRCLIAEQQRVAVHAVRRPGGCCESAPG